MCDEISAYLAATVYAYGHGWAWVDLFAALGGEYLPESEADDSYSSEQVAQSPNQPLWFFRLPCGFMWNPHLIRESTSHPSYHADNG
jgi:hypothetical protein